MNLHARFFGMFPQAYLFYVQAQTEMALGRFESAVTNAEQAEQLDPQNVEILALVKNVNVARAFAHGNNLFNSKRFTEATTAYRQGLKFDPSNPVLYCNKATCWFKLRMWKRSIEDCNQALSINPSYMKAFYRRAASNTKLERWADAVSDYEVLTVLEIAESSFHAQAALKKSHGEDVSDMKFSGEVEEVSSLEQFRAALSSPGVYVVHFRTASNPQCKQIPPLVDTLCTQYLAVNFLKIDIEKNPVVASSENVRIVPTFKVYKNGNQVKEMIAPTRVGFLCETLQFIDA